MAASELEQMPGAETTEDTRNGKGRPEERPSILLPEGPSLTHPISAGLSSDLFPYGRMGGSPNANTRNQRVGSDFAPVLGTGRGTAAQKIPEQSSQPR